jgi:hypothetical protein
MTRRDMEGFFSLFFWRSRSSQCFLLQCCVSTEIALYLYNTSVLGNVHINAEGTSWYSWLHWIMSLSLIRTLEEGDPLALLLLWNFTFRKVRLYSGGFIASTHWRHNGPDPTCLNRAGIYSCECRVTGLLSHGHFWHTQEMWGASLSWRFQRKT